MRPIRSFATALRALARDHRGGTAIEYGFIMALVVIAIFAALTNFADTILGIWDFIVARVVEKQPDA